MTSSGEPRAVKAIRNCRDAIDLLTEYIEGGLSDDDARRLEAHLSQCDACAGYLETLRKTRAALPSLRAPAMPEKCRRELRAFLERERRRRNPGGRD